MSTTEKVPKKPSSNKTEIITIIRLRLIEKREKELQIKLKKR